MTTTRTHHKPDAVASIRAALTAADGLIACWNHDPERYPSFLTESRQLLRYAVRTVERLTRRPTERNSRR